MTPPEPDALRVGNRYRLVERVGAGAMGAVWRGTDELLDRTVAIKELIIAAGFPGAEAAEESRQRLLREGRIGARLQHAHVISMFDVVVHDERPWLIMEYLRSRSLAVVLGQDGPLRPADAAALGRQVADGLAAAHAAGVVHRDIKPGNVLLADDGLVKITDFGVSRAVDDVQLTRTGIIAGTPAFLAPEVARGQQPTAASDVFALGATLYAAVEGEPPFGLDDNAYALLHKVATGSIRPPQHAGPLTPLLLHLLANEPVDRPTAAQARTALTALAAGGSGEPGDGSSPGPGRSGRSRAAGWGAARRARRDQQDPEDRADTGDGPRSPGAHGDRPAHPDRPRPGAGTGARTDAAEPLLGAAAPAGGGDRPGGGPEPQPEPSGPRTLTDLPAPRRRRRLLLPLLIVLLAVLVVGGGIAIGALTARSTPEEPAAAPPAAVPTSALPTTTPRAVPPPATAPTTAPTVTSRPAADVEAVAFVQDYYALLPGDPDSAFALLSPAAQQASGGIDGYRGFYGGLSAVQARDARSSGPGQVSATIVFTRADGTTSSEPYTFRIADGLIQSFSRV